MCILQTSTSHIITCKASVKYLPPFATSSLPYKSIHKSTSCTYFESISCSLAYLLKIYGYFVPVNNPTPDSNDFYALPKLGYIAKLVNISMYKVFLTALIFKPDF